MNSCLVERLTLPDTTTMVGTSSESGLYLEQEFATVRRSQTISDILVSGDLVDAFWYWDLDKRENCFVTDEFWEALGLDPIGRHHKFSHWIDRVFEEDRESVMANVAAHLADPAVPFDQTMRMRAADGHTLLVRSRGVAFGGKGEPARMLGSHTILSDMRRNDLTDKLSEVLWLSSDAIVVWSRTCGVKRWNRGAEQLFGLPKPAILRGQHFDQLSPTFPQPFSEIERQVASGTPWGGEVEWTRPDGRKVITETKLQRISVNCGVALILEVDHDITHKVELAQRQRTMSRELSHRVKNLFAVTRSLVKLTARGHSDVPMFVAELDRRISALAAAHVASLGHAELDGAPLIEVLTAVLSAYPPHPAALSMAGPPIILAQDRLTAMGLVLNELATNALKHGAWGTVGGHVAVDWAVSKAEGGDVLSIRWKETVPDFVPPATVTPGFGTQLIDLSLRQLAGTLSRRFGPEGLELTLIQPIAPGQPASRPPG